MRYLSVCAGIEAATVAWHHMGWEAAGFSEIEKFPSQVLDHHYPNVLKLGDMTKYKEWDIGTIDILVGGTPCQSFSVAGLRKGMADPRGNLALVYCGILDHFRPKWFVWENVPGVLSSNGGRDFGSFLGAVAELGYGFSYRVLDAQWFGVAQRRRRVFVVGCLGNWRSAAEVLFESESLRRDLAPSREKGQKVAPTVVQGPPYSRTGNERVECDAIVAQCLTTGVGQRYDPETETILPIALAENTIGRQPMNGGNGDGFTVGGPMYTLNATGVHGVAKTFYNKGFRQGENYASPQKSNAGTLLRILLQEIGEETFAEWGLGILNSLQSPEVLRQALHGLSIRPAAFSKSWVVYCALSRQKNDSKWLLQSLREAGCQRCSSQGWQLSEQYIAELGAYLSELSQPGAQAKRFVHDMWIASEGFRVLRQALSKVQEMGRSFDGQNKSTYGAMQVRRLTVEECEFLQGFPRGYTDIQPNGKPTPDGPRYKALGNSMAVPVMKWIGERIND